MDSDRLNRWLTLIANFGVLIGIVLLVFELRQTQHLAETDSAFRRYEQMQLAQLEMALSESLASIRVQALTQGINSLNPIELYRLQMWENSVRIRMQSQYDLYQRGYLDESTAQEFVSRAARNLPYWEELGLELGAGPFINAVKEAAGRK